MTCLTPTADRPLDAVEFVAFDVETTGCAAESSRMVEIGAVRFSLDGRELDRFQTVIDPRRPIPAAVVRVHGITDAVVRGCPTEAEVLPGFLTFLGEPRRTILMAHNAGFDMAFVGQALARSGLPAPPHGVIDTVRLSRRRAAGLPSHSLRSLVRVFGVDDGTDHRGLADSLDLARVFRCLIARPPAVGTVGELFQLAPPRPLRAATAFRPASRPAARRDTASSFRTLPAATARAGTTRAGTKGGSWPAAIAAGRAVSLVYDGGSAAGSRRRVTPLRLIAGVGVTYLLGFCHVECKQKQYRLDRIREWCVE